MKHHLIDEIHQAIQGKKHIIWDWNGTLLNDVDHAVNVINSILIEHKIELIDKRKYRQIFDFPVQKIKAGYYSDAYFLRTQEILNGDNYHPRILMQVFQRENQILSAYIDGTLPPESQEEFDQIIRSNPKLMAEVEGKRTQANQLKTLIPT